MPETQPNPYAPPTSDPVCANRLPVRETLFFCAFAFHVSGFAMFSDGMNSALYVTALAALGITAVIFSLWSTVLVALLYPKRLANLGYALTNLFATLLTLFVLGWMLIRAAYPPHWIILPIAILCGASTAVFFRSNDSGSAISRS